MMYALNPVLQIQNSEFKQRFAVAGFAPQRSITQQDESSPRGTTGTFAAAAKLIKDFFLVGTCLAVLCGCQSPHHFFSLSGAAIHRLDEGRQFNAELDNLLWEYASIIPREDKQKFFKTTIEPLFYAMIRRHYSKMAASALRPLLREITVCLQETYAMNISSPEEFIGEMPAIITGRIHAEQADFSLQHIAAEIAAGIAAAALRRQIPWHDFVVDEYMGNDELVKEIMESLKQSMSADMLRDILGGLPSLLTLMDTPAIASSFDEKRLLLDMSWDVWLTLIERNHDSVALRYNLPFFIDADLQVAQEYVGVLQKMYAQTGDRRLKLYLGSRLLNGAFLFNRVDAVEQPAAELAEQLVVLPPDKAYEALKDSCFSYRRLFNKIHLSFLPKAVEKFYSVMERLWQKSPPAGQLNLLYFYDRMLFQDFFGSITDTKLALIKNIFTHPAFTRAAAEMNHPCSLRGTYELLKNTVEFMQTAGLANTPDTISESISVIVGDLRTAILLSPDTTVLILASHDDVPGMKSNLLWAKQARYLKRQLAGIEPEMRVEVFEAQYGDRQASLRTMHNFLEKIASHQGRLLIFINAHGSLLNTGFQILHEPSAPDADAPQFNKAPLFLSVDPLAAALSAYLKNNPDFSGVTIASGACFAGNIFGNLSEKLIKTTGTYPRMLGISGDWKPSIHLSNSPKSQILSALQSRWLSEVRNKLIAPTDWLHQRFGVLNSVWFLPYIPKKSNLGIEQQDVRNDAPEHGVFMPRSGMPVALSAASIQYAI
ncbi:MAG: hypothetical protein NC924_07745 [Candidatus Omnitrophica bacterium]|nr:hypothetical protein [Candidatus Omnitrophota bacterium]